MHFKFKIVNIYSANMPKGYDQLQKQCKLLGLNFSPSIFIYKKTQFIVKL